MLNNLKWLFNAILPPKLWDFNGGGGGNGPTKYDWNDEMRYYWMGDERGIVPRAVRTLDRPYERYGGERIAPFNEDQNAAFRGVRDVVAQGGGADTQEGRYQNLATARGDYLGGGGNPNSGLSDPSRSNPFFSARITPRQMESGGTLNPGGYLEAEGNQYAGDNPYFRDVLQQGQKDITNAYQMGTAADTQRAFARGGAFGGSAHQQAIDANQSGLARNLARYTTDMQNNQYDRSANLREADIGRRLGASQFNIGNQQDVSRFNIGNNQDLQRFNIGNDLNAQQFNIQNPQGLYENALNRSNQNYENERGRMLQGAQQGLAGQGLSFDALRELMGAGNTQQRRTQAGLDTAYNDWTREQDWERNNINWFTGLLGAAQGGINSPTQGGYGQQGGNPYAMGLGALLAGNQMGLY